MAFYSHQYYREKAQELVRRFGYQEPPVDVRRIAESLGIEIVELTLPIWFSGALLNVNGDFYIVLNDLLSDGRKSFVLAHEIAHHQLHTEELCYMDNCKNDYYHHLANIYAAELCMPSFMVKQEARKWFNDYKFLAKIFGTSETAMIKRLEELDLLPKGHFSWQYAHHKDF